MFNKTKTITTKAKCINCAEEIKKADSVYQVALKTKENCQEKVEVVIYINLIVIDVISNLVPSNPSQVTIQ